MRENFTHWCGRPIVERLPYAMSTEVTVGPDAKGVLADELDLMHRMDKPFR